MTPVSSIDPDVFVACVQPLLERQDAEGLCTLLRSRWQPQALLDLLRRPHEDARKVAALSLAMIGTRQCVPHIAQLLRDPDPVTNQMAEHALWSIWFRLGTPPANRALLRGLQALNHRQLACATDLFGQAIAEDPGFAEAYNQRAITWYLRERYDQTIADCRATVERMPCHFGAWSGLGHGHAHLGEIRAAVAAYEQALSINPHLCEIRKAVEQLKA